MSIVFFLKNSRWLGATKKVGQPHGLEAVPWMMGKTSIEKLEGFQVASCEHHLLVTNVYS